MLLVECGVGTVGLFGMVNCQMVRGLSDTVECSEVSGDCALKALRSLSD
jgi:hypothetical protein